MPRRDRAVWASQTDNGGGAATLDAKSLTMSVQSFSVVEKPRKTPQIAALKRQPGILFCAENAHLPRNCRYFSGQSRQNVRFCYAGETAVSVVS